MYLYTVQYIHTYIHTYLFISQIKKWYVKCIYHICIPYLCIRNQIDLAYVCTYDMYHLCCTFYLYANRLVPLYISLYYVFVAQGLRQCVSVWIYCICIFIYIHTYVQTYIHTYIHTYVYMSTGLRQKILRPVVKQYSTHSIQVENTSQRNTKLQGFGRVIYVCRSRYLGSIWLCMSAIQDPRVDIFPPMALWKKKCTSFVCLT